MGFNPGKGLQHTWEPCKGGSEKKEFLPVAKYFDRKREQRQKSREKP